MLLTSYSSWSLKVEQIILLFVRNSQTTSKQPNNDIIALAGRTVYIVEEEIKINNEGVRTRVA